MCARLSRHQNAQHKHTLYTHAAQSESVLCPGKEREKQKREEERTSKSDHASGRDKWELSKDEAGVARSCIGCHFHIKILKHLNKKKKLS